MNKHILSLLLIVVLIITLLPGVASAKGYSNFYFGQHATNTFEHTIYTNPERTAYYNKISDFGVEWNGSAGLPQLNLYSFNDSNLYILESCVINATDTSISTMSNLILATGTNVTFIGEGTINLNKFTINDNCHIVLDGTTIHCTNDVSIASNATFDIVSGTLVDNGNTYDVASLTNVYLTKKSSITDYKLYVDENGKYGYAEGKDTNWYVTDTEYNGSYYASLILKSELNRNVVFKQFASPTYIVVLGIDGNDTKLAGLDATDGVLTVHKGTKGDEKITVTADIKASKMYFVECNGLDVNLKNASLVAATPSDLNELMIGSRIDDNKVNIKIENGGIDFTKGYASIINADVEITGNNFCGISVRDMEVDGANLNITGVDTGILLNDPVQFDSDGAVLSINNGSNVYIDATCIGVQGTYGIGGYYYNNISVFDEGSSIIIKGAAKAVVCTSLTPVSEDKEVKSIDEREIEFRINDDEFYTTDYYYRGTDEVVKGITIADKVIIVEESSPVVAPASKEVPTVFSGENKSEIKVLTLTNTYTNEDNSFSAQAPIILEDNRAFLGIRDMATVLGVAPEAIKWDDTTKTATISKSGATIEVTQGSKEIKLTYRGYIYTIKNDVSAINKDGRIYLPFRVIFEFFGYEVNWDNQTKVITCK